MRRPAKSAHVLARLRRDLGQTQKQFADRIGCSRRTIQDLERGPDYLPLSRRMAIRISQQTGASVEWLLANNQGREIENLDGKPWSEKDRQNFDAGRWTEQRDPRQRRLSLAVCRLLFEDYLQVRELMESFPVPGDASKALLEWSKCHEKAVSSFLKSYSARVRDMQGAPITKYVNSRKAPRVRLTEDKLRSIRADTDAVLSAGTGVTLT